MEELVRFRKVPRTLQLAHQRLRRLWARRAWLRCNVSKDDTAPLVVRASEAGLGAWHASSASPHFLLEFDRTEFADCEVVCAAGCDRLGRIGEDDAASSVRIGLNDQVRTLAVAVIDGIRVGSAEFNRFGRKIRGRVTCHGKRSGLGEAAVKKRAIRW
jgi:hypothetical protein